MKQWMVGCFLLLVSGTAAAETSAEKIQRQVIECGEKLSVAASTLVFMQTEGITDDATVKEFALGASTGDSVKDASTVAWATAIRNLGLGPSVSANFGTLFAGCMHQIFILHPAIKNP